MEEKRDGVSLTNLDQPLFEGAAATKRDLVDYLDAVAGRICQRFDALVPSLYDPADVERGGVEVRDRQGNLRSFPLLTISIGVARPFTTNSPPPRSVTKTKRLVDSGIGQIGALSGLSIGDSHGRPLGVEQVVRFKVAVSWTNVLVA